MDDEIVTSMREIDRAAAGVQTSAQPIRDAIRDIPHNELLAEGTVTRDDGAAVHVSVERDFANGVSVGAEAGVSQKRGWGVTAFFRKLWR